jgi:hypothetical protein
MIATRSRSTGHNQSKQLSLPFNATDLPSLACAQAQRAAVVEVLRQMLIEAVSAEVNHKETADERREDKPNPSGEVGMRLCTSVNDEPGPEQP